MMDIPTTVWAGQVKTNWDFTELKNPLQGVILDACAEGCNVVFPIVREEQAISRFDGTPVSYEDIKLLFMKYTHLATGLLLIELVTNAKQQHL